MTETNEAAIMEMLQNYAGTVGQHAIWIAEAQQPDTPITQACGIEDLDHTELSEAASCMTKAADLIACLTREREEAVARADKLAKAMEVKHDAAEARVAKLEAENVRLPEALLSTRALVAEGALVGFNYMNGTWAERIFANQGVISAALQPQPKEGEK